MNAASIRKALTNANVPFTEESGFSGFTYVRFMFASRKIAVQAEKATGTYATKHFKQWAIQVY